MKAFELIALLVDSVVLFQNDVAMLIRCHHPSDIFLRHWELIFRRGILKNQEHIVCQDLYPIHILSDSVDVEADVDMTHQLSICLEHSRAFLL